MNKLIITTFLTCSLSVALFADNKSYAFVGTQASINKYSDVSATALGLKYGQQSDDWRTTINYNYSKEHNDKLQSLIMQIDQGAMSKTFTKSPLKPYVGLSFGILQHEKSKKDKGYAYGLNGGITYILNDAVDLDLGFRAMKTAKMNNISSVNDVILSLHYFY